MGIASNKTATMKKSLSALSAILLACACHGQDAWVKLAWDRSTDSTVTGYKVYYSQLGSGSMGLVNAGDTNQVVVSALIRIQTYSFYAVAYNAVGLESVPSNMVQYTVPGATNPPPSNVLPAPTNLRAQIIQREAGNVYRVDLIWSSIRDADTEIWQSIKGEPFSLVATVPAGTMHATFHLRRREYTFKTRSVNAYGQSPFSNNTILSFQ